MQKIRPDMDIGQSIKRLRLMDKKWHRIKPLHSYN